MVFPEKEQLNKMFIKKHLKGLQIFLITQAIIISVQSSCFAVDSGIQDTESPSDTSGQIFGYQGAIGQNVNPSERTFTDDEEKSGPIEITLENAIFMMLENNRSLMVEGMKPLISETYEAEKTAVFDPVLSGSAEYSTERGSKGNKESDVNVRVDVSKYLPTGTEFRVGLREGRSWSDLYSNTYDSSIGLTITQALLSGKGMQVNMANIRQAKLNTQITEYEFRGFAQTMVAQAEETYWDYALALKRIEIFSESLELAERQHEETEELIAVGMLPEKEITAAKAEISFRRQGLIDARSNLEKIHLRFIRLLNPQGDNPWDREIILKDLPSVLLPDIKMDNVQEYVELALRFRPEVNRARLGLRRNELEIVKTRNGLLPKMDFFIDLGRSGYASSFGLSFKDLDGDHYDYNVGLEFRYEFGNRKSKATNRRAILVQDQAQESLENLQDLIEMDIRQAYIEINRSKEQISATMETLKLQEEKLEIEREKFKVGKSTMLNVAQGQRDLLLARINEIQAKANYIKSLLELYRLDGSLLDRRGISAPGSEPVS
jgi:outer membrane protein TolC